MADFTESDKIRTISAPLDIKASIDKALRSIGEGNTVAVIAHADLDNGKLQVFGRPNEHWTFMGTLEKRWKGPLKAEATVTFTF